MARFDDQNIQLGDAGRFKMAALGVGVVSLVASAAMYSSVLTHGRFFRAYLTAFMLVLAISLGGLIFTIIQHATRAGWSVAVRRLFEIYASNLRWLWILFIPIVVAMWLSPKTHLFEWAVPDIVAHDAILQGKAGFLNKGFWTVRAVIYFLIWGGLARYYLKNSVAQDTDGSVEHTHRMQRLAPVGIALFALTITLAAIDWIMSLSPHWFSTIFGVYFFAVSACGFFSAMLVTLYLLQRAGKLQGIVTPDHYQDVGKFLFAFGIVFWAYIAFSQMMLIWYGNIPEETTWFFIRSQGGWWGVSLLLLIGHFIFPFLAIMSRYVKRRPEVIAAAGAWMLFMVFVDIYWLVIPVIPAELLHNASPDQFDIVVAAMQGTGPDAQVPAESLAHQGLAANTEITYRQLFGFRPHLVDLTCVLGVLGIYVFATLHTMGRVSLVCRQDPRLDESLAFENM